VANLWGAILQGLQAELERMANITFEAISGSRTISPRPTQICLTKSNHFSQAKLFRFFQ
jgi:hypothetical protein